MGTEEGEEAKGRRVGGHEVLTPYPQYLQCSWGQRQWEKQGRHSQMSTVRPVRLEESV